MVLCGKVNKDLVTLLEKAGGRGIGLCGMDGGMFRPKRLTDRGRYGLRLCRRDRRGRPGAGDRYVGRAIFRWSPPSRRDGRGNQLQHQRGYRGRKLAVALGAKKLILLTDVPG